MRIVQGEYRGEDEIIYNIGNGTMKSVLFVGRSSVVKFHC